MAISVVGAASVVFGATNGGDVTLNFPGTPQQGDVVYVWGGHFTRAGSPLGPNAGTGYTNLITDTSTNMSFSLDRKVLGAVPDTSVLCKGTGNAADACVYGAFVLRGVDNTTPEDATPTTAKATTTNPDAPSITTVTDNAWVLALAASIVNDSSITPPASPYTLTSTNNQNDTNAATIACAVKTVAAHGAENPPSWTGWSSGAWFAVSVAVRPASTAVTASSGSYAVTGVSATLVRGHPIAAASGSYAVTGTAASVRRAWRNTAGVGVYAIAGVSAAVRKAWVLRAGAGILLDENGDPILDENGDYIADSDRGAGGFYAVNGAAVTFRKGYKVAVDAGGYSVTGSAVSFHRTYVLAPGAGSYSISGTAASLRHDWKVAAGAGSYAVTGTPANLVHAWKVAAGAGAYAVSGSVASLLHSWTVAVGAGSYNVNGTSASLLHNWRLAAGAGTYAVSGFDASPTIAAQRVLVAGAGSYAVHGAAASLLAARIFAAGAGGYNVTGAAANFVHAWRVAAGLGAYAVSGTNVALLLRRRIIAGAGTYAVSGDPSTLARLRKIIAESGIYVVAGGDAALTVGADLGAVDRAVEPLVHGGPLRGYLERATPIGIASASNVTHATAGGGFLRRLVGSGVSTPRRRPQ